MRLAPHLIATATLWLAVVATAQAAVVWRVQVRGLDEAMTRNVMSSLSLVDAIGSDVSGRRMAYLVRTAEDETREALQPFGYYAPQIQVQRDRDSGVVTIDVVPGTPVRVRDSHVAIDGEGGGDRYLGEELADFKPTPGAVFDHRLYEASKARISRRLAERGYFDADLASHRVEVTRAEHAADIALVWSSGARYDMGPVSFLQTPKQIIRPGLFDKLVYWDEGSYYHQGKLDRLRKSLLALDYFSRIDIEAQPENAVDKRVPLLHTRAMSAACSARVTSTRWLARSASK